jgi:hypothetical protein
MAVLIMVVLTEYGHSEGVSGAGLLEADLYRSDFVRLKKGQHLINHLVQMNTVFS